MVALFISALALGSVAIVLSIYSVRNYGFCDYKDSTGFFFVWRFLPTMIAGCTLRPCVYSPHK